MSNSKYIPLAEVMANAKKFAKNREPKPERVAIEGERERLLPNRGTRSAEPGKGKTNG